MDVWRILVYVIGAVLALRSLVGLMTIHRQNYFQLMLAEEKRKERERKRRAAAEAALAEAPPSAPASGKNVSKSSVPASAARN